MPRGIPKSKVQTAPTPENPMLFLRESIDRLTETVDSLDVTASTVTGIPSVNDPAGPWDQSSLAALLVMATERIDGLRARVEKASATIRIIVTP